VLSRSTVGEARCAYRNSETIVKRGEKLEGIRVEKGRWRSIVSDRMKNCVLGIVIPPCWRYAEIYNQSILYCVYAIERRSFVVCVLEGVKGGRRRVSTQPLIECFSVVPMVRQPSQI
jgi:hypothetical protein